MGKYEALGDVAKKIRALDNEVKLKILALLIEEGTKSITDISKELNVNFSTAHKYLEQLQKAGLVTSKQVSENRLKRLFFPADFSIDLSPKGLGKLSDTTKKTGGVQLKIFNERGEIADFNEDEFIKKYLRYGLPRASIATLLDSILEQKYDGITLLELRKLFEDALKKKVQTLQNVYNSITAITSKSTFLNTLKLKRPDILEKAMNGDIFIRNLGDPQLQNFMHDIRGLAQHSINGQEVKTLEQLFGQILTAIGIISKLTSSAEQGFGSFNYFIAPFADKLSDVELNKQLKKFLTDMDKLNANFYINLEIGCPEFLDNIYPEFFTETEDKKYSGYKKLAGKVANYIIKLVNEEHYKSINIILKIWDKKELKNLSLKSDKFYVANMTADQIDANYIGLKRFDANWKSWMRTTRVGEVQNIIINLPRLALNSNSEGQFFEKLRDTINLCIDCHMDIAELIIGNFLKKGQGVFKSLQKERWEYIKIDDSIYYISINGLNETIYLLTKKNMDSNLEYAKKILQFCNKCIKERKVSIRIALKEGINQLIADRFYYLDSKQHDLKNIKKYSVGLQCPKYEASAELHKYLPGGHCIYTPKEKINQLFNVNFGLTKLY